MARYYCCIPLPLHDTLLGLLLGDGVSSGSLLLPHDDKLVRMAKSKMALYITFFILEPIYVVLPLVDTPTVELEFTVEVDEVLEVLSVLDVDAVLEVDDVLEVEAVVEEEDVLEVDAVLDVDAVPDVEAVLDVVPVLPVFAVLPVDEAVELVVVLSLLSFSQEAITSVKESAVKIIHLMFFMICSIC